MKTLEEAAQVIKDLTIKVETLTKKQDATDSELEALKKAQPDATAKSISAVSKAEKKEKPTLPTKPVTVKVDGKEVNLLVTVPFLNAKGAKLSAEEVMKDSELMTLLYKHKSPFVKEVF